MKRYDDGELLSNVEQISYRLKEFFEDSSDISGMGRLVCRLGPRDVGLGERDR